jgi:MFS family permease
MSSSSALAVRLGERAVRNISLLALCQALAQSGNVMVVGAAARAAQSIAGRDFYWTTLPVTLQHLGVMLSIFPAALIGQRRGRAFGFGLGAAAGMLGAGLCCLGIWNGDFALLCLGVLTMGYAMANMQLYRFAAAELAPPQSRAKAISYIASSGILAAVVGPALSRTTPDLLMPLFLATFAALSGLHAVSFILLRLIEFPSARPASSEGPQRSLRDIARQPAYFVAVLSAMLAFGVMSFLMTAVPLAVVACGLDAREAPVTIFWHVMGMFVPALFTGHLIARYGVLNVMLAGILITILSVAIDISGIDAWNFRIGQMLVGVGWNFLSVCATTLLTTTYRPSERGKAQALNDFLVFGATATASLLAGILQQAWGWNALNYVALPLIALPLVGLLWLRRLADGRLAP